MARMSYAAKQKSKVKKEEYARFSRLSNAHRVTDTHILVSISAPRYSYMFAYVQLCYDV